MPIRKYAVSRRTFASHLAAASLLSSCDDAPVALPPPVRSGAFPLRAPVGGRHLIGSDDEAFLLQGDAAWSLIVALSREDVVRYLDDRRSRQFNAILVNLVEHKFARSAPRNFYGESPFVRPGDFSAPNEAYFAHAEYVLRQAEQRGILVLLAPAYLGYEGGEEGWYATMVENGYGRVREYGGFVARRYAHLANVLWVEGGDYNPGNRTLTRAVAQEIRRALPWALQTAHCRRGVAALDYWGGEPWLDVNTTYGSGPVAEQSLTQYMRPHALPFFLIEGRYENSAQGTPTLVRAQAYMTMLSGGCGHVYGSEDVWRFGASDADPSAKSWIAALDSRGARCMSIMNSFFKALPWTLLTPDAAHRFLIEVDLNAEIRAGAAVSTDASFGLIYTPVQRTLTINPALLRGPNVRARWFDPTNGTYSAAQVFPARAGRINIATPGANAGGQTDWLLMLQSVRTV